MSKFEGNHIKATLTQHGVDTGKFLSLSIQKGDLPEGSEIVVSVVDKATGAVCPIPIRGSAEIKEFAKTSRFYGQVMADGHIFNPYTTRRFIAARFHRLVKEYGCAGVQDGIAQVYHWDYAIRTLCKEVRVLRNLCKYDADGFAERSKFFTLFQCTSILEDYSRAVTQHIDRCVSQSKYDHVYLAKGQTVKKKNARPMKYRFDKLAANAKACSSYDELDTLLAGFEWFNLPNNLPLPVSFTQPYVEAGAYYTLKHHMMFEGKTMYGYSQAGSLERLREHRYSYLDLYRKVM